jgi:hypothetical protein
MLACFSHCDGRRRRFAVAAASALIAGAGCHGPRPVAEPIHGQIVEECRTALEERIAGTGAVVLHEPKAVASGRGSYNVGATLGRAESTQYVVCAVVDHGMGLEVTKLTVLNW